MSTIVTGSIAFDYLMSFPGKFTEHFLPEHMNRSASASSSIRWTSGAAAARRTSPTRWRCSGSGRGLMATAGQDFDDYRRWLEAAGIDTTLVKQVGDKFTASFFCSTDTESNQIASFYTGAMANAGELSFRTVTGARMVIVSPNDPGAMVQYAEECRTLGIPFIWDPGQQCARMSGPELADGIEGAAIVICNDYEIELMKQKTGLDEAAILAKAGALIVTRGELGCTIRQGETETTVPAVPPHSIVDPTGVGDAFRGGLLKGLAAGWSLEVACRVGSVAATYALEHLGGQSHAYTWDEFRARYATHFGAL